MDAIRLAVISANRSSDIPELRARVNLMVSVPALRERAALHDEVWERAVGEFVANRIGQPADSLFPLAIGRTVLGASRTASAQWAIRADTDLVVYLEVALTALAAGFAPDTLTPPSQPTYPSGGLWQHEGWPLRTRDFDNHLSSAEAAPVSGRHAGINPHNSDQVTASGR
jgi:hypothetical protein